MLGGLRVELASVGTECPVVPPEKEGISLLSPLQDGPGRAEPFHWGMAVPPAAYTVQGHPEGDFGLGPAEEGSLNQTALFRVSSNA